MKRFKTKKKNKYIKRIISLVIIIVILYYGFIAMNSFVSSNFSKSIVNNYISYPKDKMKYIKLFSFNNPNFTQNVASIKKENIISTFKEDKNTTSNPIIYIYNSHQKEEYHRDYLEDYNIKPTVLLASQILTEQLKDLGINAIYENRSINEILNTNNWKYGYSYKASRMLLEDTYKNNKSLRIFIDIHRDSGSYNSTTLQDNNQKYAKILFVVGLDHNNYAANLENANKLNNIISLKKDNISRGILKKSGKGVNGIYNQDFNPNCFLIEVGGQYNTIEEVKNTLSTIAESIKEYVGIENE